jgi:hypothetical protein
MTRAGNLTEYGSQPVVTTVSVGSIARGTNSGPLGNAATGKQIAVEWESTYRFEGDSDECFEVAEGGDSPGPAWGEVCRDLGAGMAPS